MTEPTDAEAWEMWLSQPLTGHAPKSVGNFARAVLAKWGAPAPVGEAVATVKTIHGVTVGYLETAVPVGTKLYTAPQPVAREPMTDEQIRAMLNKHPPEDVCGWSYRMGIDDAELHHGIKGGQNVE
jgi:hypothetical protein